MSGWTADEEGSSPVEFVLVGTLLTVLTLVVLQFAVAVYVRNLVHDAAVEGAYHAGLADTSLAEGAARTSEIISRTVGGDVVGVVEARELPGGAAAGADGTVEVTVRATLPLVGLWGLPEALEVTAHAPRDSFD